MITREAAQKLFMQLGNESWKHVIDGEFHHFGKMVFDQGLHNPDKAEPGYLESFENAWKYAYEHIGEPLTVEFYLELHKILSTHFKGSQTHTRTHARDGGKFRNYKLTSSIAISCDNIDAKVMALNYWANVLSDRFQIKPGIQFEAAGSSTLQILHNTVRATASIKTYVAAIFEHFNQERATLEHIAELFQILELLHPMEEAQRRLDLIILAKQLAEIGEPPAILKKPNASLIMSFPEWNKYLREGQKERQQHIAAETLKTDIKKVQQPVSPPTTFYYQMKRNIAPILLAATATAVVWKCLKK